MKCPDEGEIALFFEGRLDPAQIDRLERHMDGCPTCLSLLAAVAPAAGDAGRELEPPSLLRVGDLLAERYQVQKVLGAGATGYVYQAHDRLVDTVLALKVLRPRLSDDPAWVRAFSEELQLARRLTHPNVCRVFDMQQTEGHCFFTMELAARGSLREQLRATPARPLAERLDDAIALASGLAAIHGAGIVHRDVKPANVLRLDDGRLVLSDFGLARASAAAAQSPGTVGTPAYIAPEVARGEPASPRSDVWSLGVTLHELFFGARPDGQRRPARGLDAMSLALARLCRDCLAVDPGARPLDATSVLDRLRKIQHQPLRRRRRRAFTAALGIASVACGGALLTYRATRAGPLNPDDVIPTIAIGAPTTSGAVPAEHRKMVDDGLEKLRAQLAGSPYLKLTRKPPAHLGPDDYVLDLTVKPNNQGLALGYGVRYASGRLGLGSISSTEAARAMKFVERDPKLFAPRSPLGDGLQLFALNAIRKSWFDRGTRSPAARAAMRSLLDSGRDRETALPDLELSAIDLALKEDPEYLAAHTERALMHVRRALIDGPRGRAQLIADEEALARRAPDSPRALAARCRLLDAAVRLMPAPTDADFDSALALCRRASETASIGPDSYRWLANLQVARCEPGAAVQSLRRALEYPSPIQIDLLGDWATLALRERWPHAGWLDPWLSNIQITVLLPTSPFPRRSSVRKNTGTVPPLALQIGSLWQRQGSLARAHDRFKLAARGNTVDESQSSAVFEGLSFTERRIDSKAHPPVEGRPGNSDDEHLKSMIWFMFNRSPVPWSRVSAAEVLSWTSPSRGKNLLSAIPPPDTCHSAMELATLQRSLAVPPDRAAVTRLCPSNAAWVRRCLDRLATPPGGDDPLPGAPDDD